MDDRQIDAALAMGLALLLAAAVLAYMFLSLRHTSRGRAWGWAAIAGVAGLAAAAWKARHGGDLVEVLLFGGVGVVAGYVVLGGAEARARTTSAMFDRRKRAGLRSGQIPPKDFTES